MGLPNPTEDKQKLAKEAGFVNVPDIALASVKVGIPFYVALAKIGKESKGQNIYGHDAGGALSTAGRSITVCGKTYPKGSNIQVTPANAGVFLLKIAAGERSNGMGPSQITYAGDLPDGRTGGYFREMLEMELLPWVPLDNMTFGLNILMKNFLNTKSWRDAAGMYNGGPRWKNNRNAVNYANTLVADALKWKRAFGLEGTVL